MTETTLGVLLNPEGNRKVGSVGKIVPAVQCKVTLKFDNRKCA